MKKPNHQNPKAKEAPMLKEPDIGANGDHPLQAWPDNESGGWVFNDGPAAATGKRQFDLEERTARFGEAIVRFAKTIPRGPGNDRLIGQIVGSGTSVGANYCEADERVS